MTHSALLIAGGALLTSLLAALLFRPTASPEERHLRDVQKLLRALEAQRRVRDARRRREDRGRASRVMSQPPASVEAQPTQEAKPAEQEQVAGRDDRAELRAQEQLRRQEKKERAAALKAQRAAEKRASRELEQERKAALRAEQARVELQPPPAPDPPSEVADEPKQLAELPLYRWAQQIETQDPAPADEN